MLPLWRVQKNDGARAGTTSLHASRLQKKTAEGEGKGGDRSRESLTGLKGAAISCKCFREAAASLGGSLAVSADSPSRKGSLSLPPCNQQTPNLPSTLASLNHEHFLAQRRSRHYNDV
jgi:hypothetical protein